MKKQIGTIGSWLVGFMCIGAFYFTITHRKEVIARRDQEISVLKGRLADAQTDLFRAETETKPVISGMTVEDWRNGNSANRPMREILKESTDPRLQSLLARSGAYVHALNETELQVFKAGTDLEIQEAFEMLRTEFTGEDLEILEKIAGSGDRMEDLRAIVEPIVATKMQVNETMHQ